MIDYKYFDLFWTGSIDKEWKIEYDGGVITDWELFEDVIELKESLCSEKELRFGCCEASSIKFKVGNIVRPLIGLQLDVSVVVNHHDDDPLAIGKYKVESDNITADRMYREITAHDAMYDIIGADVAAWYNTILPEEKSTVTLRQFRESFLQHFGLDWVLPEGGLVNDSMAVERTITPEQISGKDVITAICEINGCFGHIGRDGKFHFIYLPQAIEGLYPSDDLFPDHAPEWMVQAKTGHLYPQDPGSIRIDPTVHIEPYCESYVTKRITKLQIRQEENDIGLIYGDGDNCYIIEDNFLVYGKSTEQLQVIAENIFGKITDIVYRPFNAVVMGNPCIEVGDPVRLPTRYEIIEGYVLERTMKGIQALRDTYVAQGTLQYDEEVNSMHKSIIQLRGKSNKLTQTIEKTQIDMADMEKELYNTIEITAQEFSANLQNTKSGLEAIISATAGGLEAEIKNTKEGLEASINATAGQIRTEVSQTYETKAGAQSNYDTLSSSISQTVDKIDIEVSRATAAEGTLSSAISLANSQIVLKADANGRMVQVALGADPKNGSAFKVDADNIDLTANDVMNLMSGGTLNLSAMDINIVSNNWSVDSQGNMVCNSLSAVKFTGQAIDDLNKAIFDSETMRRMQEIVDLYNQKFITIEELLTNDKVLFDQLDAKVYMWQYQGSGTVSSSYKMVPINGLQNYVSSVDVTGYRYLIVRCQGSIDGIVGGTTADTAYLSLTFSNDPATNNPDTPVVHIVGKNVDTSGTGKGSYGCGPNSEGYDRWYNAYIDVSALSGAYELKCFLHGAFISNAGGLLWCSKITLTNQAPS